jgi:ribosomal subunit interface protein
MNLDIQTQHVAMRPDWRRMIDEWVRRCREAHPDVVGIDVTLRHGSAARAAEEVEVEASVGGRSLRVTTHGEAMTVALQDALEALERRLTGEGGAEPGRRAHAA